MNWRRIALWTAGGLGFAGLVWGGRQLPLREWVGRIEELGAWGPAAVVVGYVVSCVLFLPGSILTVACGALFGFWWGLATAVVGSNVGATAAFLVGRHLARDRVQEVVAKHERMQVLDEVVEEEGVKIVLLTRLSPVFPFNALNYAYGLTGVSLRQYVSGSVVGMLPGTAAYVYLGTLAGLAVLGGDRDTTTVEWVLRVVGLVATFAVATYVARLARSKMDAKLEEHGVDPDESETDGEEDAA